MSECKGCGKEIIWAVDAAGQNIPLDPRPPVYMVVEKLDEDTRAQVTAAYLMDCKGPSRWMVSHLATCLNPNEFSRKARQAPAGSAV